MAFYLVQAGGKIREIIKIENNLLIFVEGWWTVFLPVRREQKMGKSLTRQTKFKNRKAKAFFCGMLEKR